MSKSIPDFINKHPFESALHRLIMCRIWMSGSCDCSGVHYLSVSEFAEFCCCSVDELFIALELLLCAGYIGMEIVQPGDVRCAKVNDPMGFVLMPSWQ